MAPISFTVYLDLRDAKLLATGAPLFATSNLLEIPSSEFVSFSA